MLRALTLALALTTPTWAAPAPPLAVSLEAATKSAKAARRLGVVLDDLHPLHGGDRYVLEGRVLTHTHQPRGGKPPVETRATLSSAQLQELARLLHTLALWEQRTADRKPRPDESRTRMMITVDGESAEVWERHNDLAENDRMVRVRGLFQAWTD